jgi:RNA-directed DNA polymerase
MTPYQRMTRGLAAAFLEGPWQDEGDLVHRGGKALGRRPRWLRPLVRRLLRAFSADRPREHHVAAFLVNDAKLLDAWCSKPFPLPVRKGPPTTMAPAPGPPSSWPVPAIVTPLELATRLGLDLPELDWFADLRGLERATRQGPLRHYAYRWKPKRNGSTRLIEAPKGRLKAIQRQILREVLAPIPPHDAAHGFRPARSVRTFVEPHAGRSIVLKMDLLDFFPTIVLARVIALFRTAGYPEGVARALAGFCTNRVPSELWRKPDAPVSGPDAWRTRQLYRKAHLPQGAPTSPALANLCAYRLDARLAGLAASAGASYTRYADDLAFSGDGPFARSIARFHVHACAIVLEENFALNTRKTRVMRQGVRQCLAGAVLNVRPNIARDDFDALKATLHNCVKQGPEGHNRSAHPDFRAHLLGRIAHVATLNPDRAARLKAMFDRVDWSSP